MDPINALRLGQIIQQEIVEECLNDQPLEIKARVVSLWKRLNSLVSSANARSQQPEPCRQTFATSR